MHLSGSLIVISLIYHSAVLCESEKLLERKGRHLLTLFGYINGYEVGQNHTYQLPPLLLSQIVIVPIINQPDISTRKATADEGHQENGSTVQRLTNAKLILNQTHLNDDDGDIEVNFRQTLNRGAMKISSDKVNSNLISDNLVGNVTTILNKTDEQNTTSPTNTADVTQIETETTKISTTEANGPYPTPAYNSQGINTLTLTTAFINRIDLPKTDDRWKNITINRNLSKTTKNDTQLAINSIDEITTMTEKFSSTTSIGPYSAALYDNAMIDQLSITTNSYTNEESPLPPPQDDRWHSFYSLKKKTFLTRNGFKPLAGLYYDGFLHKPLSKMPGFIPYNNRYLY